MGENTELFKRSLIPKEDQTSFFISHYLLGGIEEYIENKLQISYIFLSRINKNNKIKKLLPIYHEKVEH